MTEGARDGTTRLMEPGPPNWASLVPVGCGLVIATLALWGVIWLVLPPAPPPPPPVSIDRVEVRVVDLLGAAIHGRFGAFVFLALADDVERARGTWWCVDAYGVEGRDRVTWEWSSVGDPDEGPGSVVRAVSVAPADLDACEEARAEVDDVRRFDGTVWHAR